MDANFCMWSSLTKLRPEKGPTLFDRGTEGNSGGGRQPLGIVAHGIAAACSPVGMGFYFLKCFDHECIQIEHILIIFYE